MVAREILRPIEKCADPIARCAETPAIVRLGEVTRDGRTLDGLDVSTRSSFFVTDVDLAKPEIEHEVRRRLPFKDRVVETTAGEIVGEDGAPVGSQLRLQREVHSTQQGVVGRRRAPRHSVDVSIQVHILNKLYHFDLLYILLLNNKLDHMNIYLVVHHLLMISNTHFVDKLLIYLDKLLDQNSYQGYSLIKECVKRNKNFIVWDLAVNELIQSVISDSTDTYTGKVFVTSFSKQDKENLFASMEHTALKSPSICVVGTNKKQGKFTTQLIIKELLKQSGYKVSHLATEPQGIVLGADITFPIGHKGTVDVDIMQWNKSLRFLTQVLEEHTKPDIIITGSQGSILPKYPMNDSNAAEMLSYVKSFYPDALICTISPNDSLDYIKRTTDVIQAFVNCEVLFYVLTPFEYTIHFNNQVRVSYRQLDEEEYQNKLAYFNGNLNAPTFNIKNTDSSQRITDIIINKFSKG